MAKAKTKSKTKKTKKTTAATSPKRESAVITMLLDESGSMLSLWKPTIDGYNEYVDTLRKSLADHDVHFSALKFDSPRGVEKLQVGASIKDAIRLTTENYTPRGSTPLLDAVGRTIEATDEVAGKNKATKIIVVVQTDGAENASKDFSLDKIKQMIEERQGKGWEFVFIGAGINAFDSGVSMGFGSMNTMSYGNDAGSTQAVFLATASNSVGHVTRGLSMNYTAKQSFGSGEDRTILKAKMAHAKTEKGKKPDLTRKV